MSELDVTALLLELANSDLPLERRNEIICTLTQALHEDLKFRIERERGRRHVIIMEGCGDVKWTLTMPIHRHRRRKDVMGK